MKRHIYPSLFLLAAAAFAGACQNVASHQRQSADFDQRFLDQMSQHHAGAIAMAQIALQKGSTDHVKTMGKNLIDKQQAEVQKLQGWRSAWYGAGPAPTPRDKDRQTVEQLSHLQGIDFDKTYATKMIEHHEEGIAMAKPAVQQATHPEIRAFSQQMIDDQTHEIEHLQSHLKEWSGSQ